MYSENGTYYVPHPAAINYTADPSPELDRAWEELTWGRSPPKSKQKAVQKEQTSDRSRPLRCSERAGGKGCL
jgi:hypothetical protein